MAISVKVLDVSGIAPVRSTTAGGAKMCTMEWAGWSTETDKYITACGIKETSMAMVCAS